ncbi:MAG TPA: NAD-dependent dihydropyrimidine dehydrogenase subunit PreA [Lachnospiraceae bacterium]|nr:NAD-dependent dihydropyrimidine dehydrogenase subunit PreA [Lachnospiraceae bacterium]
MSYKTIKVKTETGRCLLCHDAPCNKACPYGVPISKMIRSLRFENEAGASKRLAGGGFCQECTEESCMKVCTRGKIDYPIHIKDLLTTIDTQDSKTELPIDLSIDFCGVHCENPFFLSSSVIGSNYEMVAKAFDMGWAGVAFKTVGTFVPKEVSPRFDALEKESTPWVGFKNIEQISDHTFEENLEFMRKLKQDYPEKVMIASIMGQNEDEWTFLAKKMEEIGADIIECNFSCPHMTGEGLGSDVGSNPELVRRYTQATRKGTKLPILAKMTPNITNMEIPAVAAVEAGADGIAAINTIKSIMNINLSTFSSGPDVMGKSSVGGYSGKAVKPIALRFIRDMKSNERLKSTPISGMGGIETWKDAAEFIALGCETVQVTTAVMQYGYRIIEDLIDGMSNYMRKEGYSHINEIVGKALSNIIPAEELNRHSICYPKFDRSLCVSCKRCYISCYDGGHQAITIGSDGKPILNGMKCVGCQLCVLICPASAISTGTRV